MKVITRILFICSLNFILLAGCATSGGLTRKDVLQRYDFISQLDKELISARGQKAVLLAPDSHEKASLKLEEAVSHAVEARKADANKAAEEGLKTVNEMRGHMERAREIMDEVLNVRQRAVNEGAYELYTDEFEKVDDRLSSASALIEKDAESDAKELRPDILAAYSSLELRALKEGKAAAAEAAINRARENEADEYAPETLKAAAEELKLVTSVLDADRTQTEKADAHAGKAIWLAEVAGEITKTAKMFEDGDYELEDILLWYHDQLELINAPFSSELPFNKPNQTVIHALRESIESLLKALDNTRSMLAESQERTSELKSEIDKQRKEYEAKLKELVDASSEQISKLRVSKSEELAEITQKYEKELSAEAQKRAEIERREKEARKRFEDIDNMFNEEEANVYRKGNNVLIEVHGFDFPPGESEIQTKNFSLLDKLVNAINIFPESKVKVSGHTDSTGRNDMNLSLSIDRARSVSDFLVKLGKISPDRVESEGFGENKPVAKNDTKEGRARNRRIEVLIINSQKNPGN